MPYGQSLTAFLQPAVLSCGNMNITTNRARQIGLVLLLTGVLNQAHAVTNHGAGAPQSSGLLRLGRDLMRRTGGEATGAEGTSEWISSRSIRTKRG
jgi:hypothetical protein